MDLYKRFVLPPLINAACGCRPIARQREKIVPFADGVVLELGFGSGLNLPHYNAARVRKIYALEPDAGMRRLADKALKRTSIDVEMVADTAEHVSLPAQSVDTVLVTYALCTIPDPIAALNAAARALKPGGRLLFCEHGLAPDAAVVRWQERIEPMWRIIGGGCHLTRDIPSILNAAGFTIGSIDQMYLPKSPKWAGFNCWGSAHIA